MGKTYKLTIKNPNNQKYLFLDIDGVLNSFDDYNMTGDTFLKNLDKISFILSDNQIQILNNIVEKYNPTIILSSYWRTRYSVKEINRMFEQRGFIGEITDKTDEKGKEHKDRWGQIKRYINKHNIKNFIILDDETISENEICPNFIKTNSYKGLDKTHLQEIDNIWS